MTFRRAILSFYLAAIASILASSLTFASGADGVNGTTIGSGTRGGNAGIVNITVPGLFNTTNARFIGRGGYTTLAGTSGGNGGVLQLNYHGLIRNFTNPGASPATNGNITITPGNSTGGVSGNSGGIVYAKDSVCPRDADISGDGRITATETARITLQTYNNVTGDSTFVENNDINCDGIINILDLARVGFEWDTR